MDWANHTKDEITKLLNELNRIPEDKSWQVTIQHIEYVKSYGPRVDHCVLDLQCIPQLVHNK